MMGIVSNNQGEPFEIDVLDEKRKQFAIHVLLLFISWRILKDLRVKTENDWWPAFLYFRENCFFSDKCSLHIRNQQSWNDVFLCKETGKHIGIPDSDNDRSDSEDSDGLPKWEKGTSYFDDELD